jgi:hypothetical protein
MIATVQVQYHTDLSTSPQDTPSNTSVVIDAVVYAQRDSTTNDVAEIAEREPGCNIATTLVFLDLSLALYCQIQRKCKGTTERALRPPAASTGVKSSALVPDLAALIDAVVYAQRDSTTNDVAEIAEREPGCNIQRKCKGTTERALRPPAASTGVKSSARCGGWQGVDIKLPSARARTVK